MLLIASPFFAPVPTAARLLSAMALIASMALLIAACGAEPTESPAFAPPAATPAATIPTATPTPAATATNTPAPTNKPLPTPTATPLSPAPLVSLPEDEAPHDTPVEWWYFNGFLWDENGREYSFHYVTFQAPTVPLGTPHLLHATIGDHERGVHHAEERGTLAVLDPSAPSVDVDAEGWVMRGDGESYELRFDLGGTAIELTAASAREPVLHDSTGLVNLGEAGDTYYYSRTRLQLNGWVADSTGRREVSGSGWMDHQWGDVSRVDVGWDWVNLQLDDGSDLMVAVVWKPVPPGQETREEFQPIARELVAAYATSVSPSGAAEHVPGGEVSLEALGSWVSPETGIEYPMGWLLRVETLGAELELTPVLKQAEFDAGAVLPVVYWEGAVTASGLRKGAPVEGRGFVELVGYDPGQGSADIPLPR